MLGNMTELTTISDSGELVYPPPVETVPLLSLLTVPFIIGIAAVSPLDTWNYLVKGLGVLLAIAYFVRSLSSSLRISTELLLYLSWIVWALSGVFVAISREVFWVSILTLVQILIMFFIVSGATFLRKALTMNLVAFLAGTLVVAIYSLVTGEYTRAEETSDRVAGLALDANAFGFLMVTGTMILAYLWMLPHRHSWLWYGPLALLMAGTAVGTVLSGSRNSILSMVVFYIAWFFFCYRTEIFRRPKVLAAMIFACVVGFVVFAYLFVGSVAEERFESAVSIVQGRGGNEGSLYMRLEFYRVGLKMLLDSPVVGVGLNQFYYHSGLMHPAHSEYAEVFADTGVVGGLIYFSIFVVLWIRAGKIAKYTDDLSQFRIARLVRAFLIVIMVSNLGRWNYYDKITWVVFASFIGYTNAVWQELSYRLNSARVDEPPA